MTSVSHGKPCAGNPHARFEEGASAPESPRRDALLHKKNVIRMAVTALAVIVASAMLPMAAKADGVRRPMALMVMFDGLRADAIESGEMPNVMALRNGTWQAGYNGAWSVTGQTAPGVDTVSAPNHVTIATGVIPSKHGVTANGGDKCRSQW